jgi:hypothetical protein
MLSKRHRNPASRKILLSLLAVVLHYPLLHFLGHQKMNSQIREQLKIPIEKVANNNNSASQTKSGGSGNGSSFGSRLQKFL